MATIRFRARLADERRGALTDLCGASGSLARGRLAILLPILIVVLSARGGFQMGRVDPAASCQMDVAVKPDSGYFGDTFAFYIAVHPPCQRSIPTVLGMFHDGAAAARPIGFGRFVAYGGFVDPGESEAHLEVRGIDREGREQCSQISPSVFNLGVRH